MLGYETEEMEEGVQSDASSSPVSSDYGKDVISLFSIEVEDNICPNKIALEFLITGSFEDSSAILERRLENENQFAQFLANAKDYMQALEQDDRNKICNVIRGTVVNYFAKSSRDKSLKFLVILIDCSLYDWFVILIGFDAWKTLNDKMPSLLYGPCLRNNVSMLKWSIGFLWEHDFLDKQMREIFSDGNHLMTLICKAANPNMQMVQILLQNGFPFDMLLHKVGGKNSSEWLEATGQQPNEIKALMEGLIASSPKQNVNEHSDVLKTFINLKGQFRTQIDDINRFCDKFKDEQKLVSFQALNKKLEFILDQIEELISSCHKTTEMTDSLLLKMMTCVKNLQTLYGFLRVKYASHLRFTSSNKSGKFTQRENSYTLELLAQLEKKVNHIEKELMVSSD